MQNPTDKTFFAKRPIAVALFLFRIEKNTELADPQCRHKRAAIRQYSVTAFP
jgi:hypothetical protein